MQEFSECERTEMKIRRCSLKEDLINHRKVFKGRKKDKKWRRSLQEEIYLYEGERRLQVTTEEIQEVLSKQRNLSFDFEK